MIARQIQWLRASIKRLARHPFAAMWTRADAVFAALFATAWANPALAQITTVTSTVTLVCTTVKAVGAGVFFIALAWAAFEMIFGNHRWSKVILLVAGGTVIGAAGQIAAALGVTGTTC